MWNFIRSQLFVVLVFTSFAHGILVVGSKFIRENQNYRLVVSNFINELQKVDLMVKLEGQSDSGGNILNVTKMVEVRRQTNRMVEFNFTGNLPPGNYKITMKGHQGFRFHKEADLVFLSKVSGIVGLIQLNKPVFKPGDTVKFRVIVLDMDLKPPPSVEAIRMTIQDPQKNVIREWDSAPLYAGVFESDLPISPNSLSGIWKMVARAEGKELVSKTFEVKEYVLSTFDLQVTPSVVPLVEHQALNLTIAANYHFGKPVNGLAKIELYLEDDKLDQKKELEVYGAGQVELRFVDSFEVHHDHQDVRIKVSFIEQFTNHSVVKNEIIKVFKYPYRVELVKESPEFRRGHTFKCALKFTYGTPAAGIKGAVEIDDVEHKQPANTSDSNGLIELELHPSDETHAMGVSYTNENVGIGLYETIYMEEIGTNAYIKLELKSPIRLNNVLQFTVTCTERMTFFVYYVLAKGIIIDAGYMRPKKQKKIQLQLNATEQMFRDAKVVVFTVASRTLVYDCVEIDFQQQRNDIKFLPGRQLELRISGRPGAYVGLAAYDKALLTFDKHHVLVWEDIELMLREFRGIDRVEYDCSVELFARTMDDIMVNVDYDRLSRKGQQSGAPISRLVADGKFSLESWLWKNVTIGESGNRKLIETVPDASTTWYLTGFSIDPVYGLGIIKNPIEVKTVQPFYIVENLPDTFKRGEVVLLQFALFNNLEAEYVADITLHNEDNQMEFIGHPLEGTSYTKTVSVPPNVGVPITFEVKARRLGKLVVYVNASIKLGIEKAALQKEIQVIP